ncbi:MAG: helix-turn-helix domain-containing protein [Bacteroidales bacterium]|nr:helix-turn-helix domain-containing protein [Bacteroidales bacterium]
MDIIEPILYIGLSQTFFAGLLIATKKPVITANRLMAIFFFMLFLDLTLVLIKIKILTFYSFPFIAFTYGPILYLYIWFMVHPGRKFNLFNLLHFIPFVVFLIFSVVYRSEPVFTDLQGVFFVSDRFISLRIVYVSAFFLSITIYSFLAFKLISKHQNNLLNSLSYRSPSVTLNWLKILSITFYVLFTLFFILGGIDLVINFLPFDPYYTIFPFIALFSFIYSFKAVQQPAVLDVFTDEEKGKANSNDNIAPEISPAASDDQEPATVSPGKYYRSGLKKEEADELLKDLIKYMESEKPYLDRDLTIHRLSSLVGIPKHYITQVLNENYNRNFFTFVNEYRVKEVINRLKDPANRNYTILAIAFDAGFNAKSSFNTIFKSITGHTPSDYKKRFIDSAD